MIGVSPISLNAFWNCAAASVNWVSRNSRSPCLFRFLPSSCSQPASAATLPSRPDDTSTTRRIGPMLQAVRACALRRLMERATIHSVVGVINGLRLSIYLPSYLIPQQHRQVTPPFTMRATRLDCDPGADARLSRPAHRDRDGVAVDVGLVAGRRGDTQRALD